MATTKFADSSVPEDVERRARCTHDEIATMMFFSSIDVLERRGWVCKNCRIEFGPLAETEQLRRERDEAQRLNRVAENAFELQDAFMVEGRAGTFNGLQIAKAWLELEKRAETTEQQLREKELELERVRLIAEGHATTIGALNLNIQTYLHERDSARREAFKEAARIARNYREIYLGSTGEAARAGIVAALEHMGEEQNG